MQLLSFCCWHLIFRHSAGATNHSCKCCFSKQIFSPGDGHVVMPDLTDFFDRKVSKVSLIFAVIITSVLSAVVIFHCLSYNFTGRCCYELQGSFSTFIAILWRLVSWSEKRQRCFLYFFDFKKSFVVDIWFFGFQQLIQITAGNVVFLTIFSRGDWPCYHTWFNRFFDQKVSKVTLIFTFMITSVLSAVAIFHFLSYNFTGRCSYELQCSFSTFIKKFL